MSLNIAWIPINDQKRCGGVGGRTYTDRFEFLTRTGFARWKQVEYNSIVSLLWHVMPSTQLHSYIRVMYPIMTARCSCWENESQFIVYSGLFSLTPPPPPPPPTLCVWVLCGRRRGNFGWCVCGGCAYHIGDIEGANGFDSLVHVDGIHSVRARVLWRAIPHISAVQFYRNGYIKICIARTWRSRSTVTWLDKPS